MTDRYHDAHAPQPPTPREYTEAEHRAALSKALGQINTGAPMAVGDKVSKVGSDYRFDGVVVAVFTKLSGVMRIVVEDDRGTLFIGNMQGYVRR